MSGWVVLLELARPVEVGSVDRETTRLVLQAIADMNPTALLGCDRWAVQVDVAAEGPADALQVALARWRDAAARLAAGSWAVVRAEVVTTAEFDRECGEPDAADGGEEPTAGVALLEMAFRDEVTGLATAAVFSDCLARALARGAAVGRQHAVLLIDLEGLAGTPSLAARAAPHVVSALRGDDVAACLASGRIAALLRNVPVDAAQSVAARLVEHLRDAELPASVGVAFGDHDQACRDVLREAAAAAVVARRAGGGAAVMTRFKVDRGRQ